MIHTDFRTGLPEPIKTERLILRAPAEQDVVPMARLANNERIHAMLARLPYPYTREDAVEFITNGARDADEHAFSVLLRDESFIGVVGLHFPAGKPAELGYWIGEPYWAEGYGSEAVLALVAHADAAGCPRLVARARAQNKASAAILTKAGFIETGEHIEDCGPHTDVPLKTFEREGPQ